MCQNLSPIGLLVYKSQFSKQWKNLNFMCWKHCFLMEKNSDQTKQWLDKSYSNSAPSETTVKRWYADFKRSCTDTNDTEHSAHPNSAVVLENTKKLYKMVNRKLKLREIAEELKISEGSAFTILHEHLSMRKLWVLLKVGTAFAHSWTKTTCWQFKVLFAIVLMQQKRVFTEICDNGWNMDPLLHSRVKSAISWMDSSRWKQSKVTKDTNISRQDFGLRILGHTRYFVHWSPWERKNH